MIRFYDLRMEMNERKIGFPFSSKQPLKTPKASKVREKCVQSDTQKPSASLKAKDKYT